MTATITTPALSESIANNVTQAPAVPVDQSSGVVSGVVSEVVQYSDTWTMKLTLTGIIASMTVNALVTGLIVFKILKVFMEVKAARTSVERTFKLGSSGGTEFRHIIFVIIESGMALFAIQLVRVGLLIPPVQLQPVLIVPDSVVNLIIGINEVLNVIINLFITTSFVLLIAFTWLGHHTNNNFGAGLNEIVLR